MQSIHRMVSVLSAMQYHPNGIGVIDLAEELELPASSLHRLLQSLKREQLVWQNPINRKYKLGVGLLELGWPLLQQSTRQGWRLDAHRMLAELSITVQLQVFLGLLVQDTVVIVEAIYPSQEDLTPISVPCMDRIPVHCGSTAKAILAFLPNQDLRRIVTHCNFRPYTMYTLASQRELLDHLSLVNERGYAMCNEEFEHGKAAIAVPVLDEKGTAFASLGTGPISSDVPEAYQHSLVRKLQHIARRVSRIHAGHLPRVA